MDEEFQTALQASLFTSVPGLEDLVSGPAGGHTNQILQTQAVPTIFKELT